VDEYFHRFLGVVRENRHLAGPAAQDRITTGRVFTGREAAELGLVDGTGMLEDAITLAKKLANVPDAAVVLYRRPYGYGGSIYADASIAPPKSKTMELRIPLLESALPPGFYYLWRP
jgi:protease-4